MNRDQFDDTQPHCVTISYRGTGLDVDVVPVLYEGDPDDLGYLVDKDSGDRVLTSIPRHLEFIRTRKNNIKNHYSQVVRLAKWWARQQKQLNPDFKCKSFMLELILAHLADRGLDFTNYPAALESLFSYIVRSDLEDRIVFTDYYAASDVPQSTSGPIQIIDPISPENNIASRYTQYDRDRLVAAAEEAADAISEAEYATTKSRAVECWQIVFGPSFKG